MRTLRESLHEILLAYGNVFFLGQPRIGLGLLAITWWIPWQGASGLAAVVIALGAARLLGLSGPGGTLLFNPLLCGLALGCWLPAGSVSGPAYTTLLMAVSLAALGATVVLNHCTLTLAGAPARSLPFYLIAVGLHWFLQGAHLYPLALPVFPSGNGWWDLWTHSLGSVFFVPTAGLAVMVLLALGSRFHLLHAAIGFTISASFLHAFSYPPVDAVWLNLNCILSALAVGGVFFLPSRSSLILAAAASLLCAFLGLALAHALPLIDAPILTLPFNLTTLGVVAALRWRSHNRGPQAVVIPSLSPETTLRAARLLSARVPQAEVPTLALPFDGEWIVTQGFDGKITHQGAWRYALDFELASASQEPARPESLDREAFPSFGAPIIAPAEGVVVRVVNDVPDNPIGGTNLLENWGNTVLIEIAPQIYVQLSHFRCGGVRVREGERVRRGQLLGYLGNSGRSPFPHLHLQMQLVPEIGAATIPFRLSDYRSPHEKWTYHFRGLPREGQVVAGGRATAWATQPTQESTQTYRVFTAGREHRETITQTPEGSGFITWTSSRGAVLRTQAFAHMLVPLSYEGPAQSVLSLLYLAGRLPLSGQPGLQWTEIADVSRFRGPLEQMAHDFAGAYLSLSLPTIQGEILSLDKKRRQVAISCAFRETRSQQPDRRLELHFADGLRLVSARLETPLDWMHVVAEEPAETPSPARLPDALMAG